MLNFINNDKYEALKYNFHYTKIIRVTDIDTLVSDYSDPEPYLKFCRPRGAIFFHLGEETFTYIPATYV